MIIHRRGHWYAIELPVPILAVLLPIVLVLVFASLSWLRGLLG